VYQKINNLLNPGNCETFCQKFELPCRRGWRNQNEGCEKGAVIGCGGTDGGSEDHICYCGNKDDPQPPDNDCKLAQSCVKAIGETVEWLTNPSKNTAVKPPDGAKQEQCEWAFALSIRDNGISGYHAKCSEATSISSYLEDIYKKCYASIYESASEIRNSNSTCEKFWERAKCQSDYICGYGYKLKELLPQCKTNFCTRAECCGEEHLDEGDKENKNPIVKAIAQFGQNTESVTGYILFTQIDPNPAKVEVNLKGLNDAAEHYHIHVGTIPKKLYNGQNDCSFGAVGGHLNVDGAIPDSLKKERGDLSGKFGKLNGTTSIERTYDDKEFFLDVQSLITDRNCIVIHKYPYGEPWVCANIIIKTASDDSALPSMSFLKSSPRILSVLLPLSLILTAF